MNATLRALGVAVIGTTVLGACATKGFVRQSVRDERAARIAADSALQNDITTVRSDVATLRNDLQSLRTELGTLRTEFGARITAMEDGLRFAFPVTFAFDDATVRDADREALDRFARVASKYYPNSKITVEGFADAAGSTRYNLDLSRRRAESVAAYLTQNGLNAANLQTVGYGETRQVAPGAVRDDAGAETNRRVVFVIETKGEGTVALAPEVSQH